MASTPEQRQLDERAAFSARFGLSRVHVLAAVAALVVAAVTVSAVLAQLAGWRTPEDPATPGFLATALGAPQADAPLVREPDAGIRVTIDEMGFTVTHRDASLGVSSDRGSGPWTTFEHGAVRATPYGSETITVEQTKTEQYLTVVERQGKKTWRWRLETTTLEPTLRLDGAVELLGATGENSGITILPAAILDSKGRNITAASTRWSLDRDDHGWLLELALDDSLLPLPYVIDPASAYPSPLELRNTATSETGSWDLDSGTGAIDMNTANVPAQNATGWYAFNPGVSNTTQLTTLPTTTDGSGWIVDPVGGATGFPAGTWSFAVQTDIPNGTFTTGTAVMTVGVWKGTVSGGVFTPTGTILSPTDDPAAQNIRPNVSTNTVTVSYSLSKIALAAGETLFVDYWRHQTGGINATQAPRRQLDFYVNDGVAQITHPAADDAGPTHSVLLAPSPTGAHYAGGRLYYKSDAAGSFAFRDALTDTAGTGTAASGVLDLDYPAIATTGWTHTVETVTTSPNYQSSSYSWTANPGNPANQTLTAEDNALQQSTSVVQFVADTTAPTGAALTVNGVAASGGATSYDTTGSFTIGTRTDYAETQSGTAAGLLTSTLTRENGTLSGNGCSAYGAPITLVGAPAQGPFATGCYRYTLTGTDNVGNAVSITTTVKVDTTGPSVASVTVGSVSNANDSYASGSTFYYRPAGSGGTFDVATVASDGDSGLGNASYPALAGGFTPASSAGIAPPSPYSRTYTWPATSGTDSGLKTVSVANNAGGASTQDFRIVSDSTAPAGGALTVNGVVASGSGTTGYDTDGSFTIGTRTDYAETLSATAAGFRSSTLTREDGTLFADACSSYGGPATLVGTPAQNGLAASCYRYTLTGTDNVGNTVAVSTVVKVDTTAPTSAADALSTYATSTPITVGYTAGDAATGVDSVQLWVDGPGAGGYALADTDTTPASPSFSYTASEGDGVYRFYTRARDNAGNTEVAPGSEDTTTVVDTTNPTSAADALPAFTGTTSIAVTYTSSDTGGSGVDEVELWAKGPSDGAYVLADTDTTPGSASFAYTASQGEGTYRFYTRAGDVAGNTEVAPGSEDAVTVLETSPPTAPLLSFGSFTNASATGTTVFVREGAAGGFTVTADATDPDSGVAGHAFPSFWGEGGSVASDPAAMPYTFAPSDTAPFGVQTVTATNGAGLMTAGTGFTVVADTLAPVTTPSAAPAPNGNGWHTSQPVDVTLAANDGGSGVAAIRYTTDGSDPTALSPLYSGTIAVTSMTTVKFRAWDAVGNVEAVGSLLVRIDTTTPSVPTLALAETDPGSYVSGTTLFYNPSGANSGTFTVDATASDSESGVDKVAFPALAGMTGGGDDTSLAFHGSYAWTSSSTASGAQTVTAHNGAGLTSSGSFTLVQDTTAPTSTIACDGAACSAGWYTSSPVSVSLAASDGGSGLASLRYTLDGSDPVGGTPYTGAFDVAAAATVRWATLDQVGNLHTGSELVRIDTTAPSSPNLSFDSFANASATGSTVFFRPGATGGFTVTATTADGGSGVQHVAFPALGANWTGDGNDASAPYAQAYTFAASAADPAEPNDVVARNGADLDSAATPFTVTADATAPTTTIACDGVPCPGGWTTSAADVTLSADDGPGSGVSEIRYTLDGTDPLASGTLSSGPFGVAATTTVRFAAVDAVGNAEAAGSQLLQIDDSKPTTPTLAFSAPTNAHWDGSVLWFRAGATGGFTVTPSSSDPQSGVATYHFPALGSGWSNAGGAYTFAGAAADPAEPNDVTAENAADLVSDPVGFTVTADGAAPTGASVTVTGGATATLSVAVATDAGTDAGSGVDTGSLVVERQEADLDNGDGTCDAFGSWTTVTPTAGADTGVVSGKCYRYRVRSSDLVGNEATSAASATVQVDTAAPGVTLDDPGANLAGAVTLSATAMDAASGIATVAFQRSPADAGTWTTITGSWDTTGVADGLYDLRAIGTDGAGNTATSPVVEDRRVDNTSPDTTIETAPADPDNDATPTFVFSSTESGSTFQCRFDGGAWGGCASPLTTGPLPDGVRTFEVRAVDASANPDPTPASHSWVLDMIAPSGGSITVADGWDTDGAVAIATDNGTDIGGSGVAAASTIVEREAATLTTGTCGSFDAAWSAVATPDASVAGGACYRYRLRVRDHAGNWATYPSASVVKVDLTAPAVPALALANVAGTQVVGTTAYFRPGASGSFTVTPAATDPESGGVTFSHPNLGTGWSRVGTTWSFDATAGDPNEPNNVTATNAAGLTSTAASFTVTADAAAPGTTATAAPAVNGFGWHTASPVSVTLTAADGDSGAKEIRYTTDSSVPGPTSPLYSAPVDVVALGTTTVTFRAEDNVGNLEAPATIVVRVDTTAPTTPTLSYSGLANASFDGTVTWFRPGAAGGFTVTPSAGDPESGVVSHAFPALGSGWSNTGATYAFTAAAADPVEPNEVVTTNGAGLASAGAPITVTADSTAPVSTATCDAAACSAGWYTTKPVTVVLTASDAQSGLDRTDWSTDGAAPANEYLAPLSLGAEGTTTVRVSARDNVGNVEATVSQDVRIDTVAPTASIVAVAPYLHGTVALTSTQSDATSGVGSVQFQIAPAGTGTWTNVPATWDTTGTANGQYDVHVRVTDVAGNVADSTPVASVWVDNLAPVLALDPPASPASGSVLLTSTANDAHSGLDTIDYEYSAAGANDWRTTALTGALWDTTQLVDGAYDVRARAADRSGNVSGWSVVNGIAVDNAPPTVSVTAPLDGSFVNGAEADPFTLAAAASDAGSGVASVEFLACATTGSTCSSWTSIDLDTTPAYTGAWTLPGDGVRQVKAVATDNAGHTSEAGVTVTVDRTAPATSLTAPSAGANVRGTFPLTASAADATSGVDSVDFQRSPAGASSWTTIATDSDGGDGWTGSLDTTLGGTPDGLYDMRVLVTDEAGNAQTDVAANVRVDNTAPTGTLTDPGQFLRGSLALSGTAADTGSGVASVAFQRSPESADTWTTIATDTNGGDGWSNSFDTTAGGTPDGRYDLRVLVTDNAGNTFTHALPGRTIDNTRPTAAIANPGTNLRLAVTLGGTADDVTAGVATVAFEYDNGGGWQLISTDNDGSDGWSASLNTTLPATPDGLYAFRLTATDRAGNQETSQIGGRRIDNTAPTASLNDPGPYLMGAVQLAASATDGGSGIDVVRFERSATGSGGPWTQVGPDASFSGGAWRSTWNTNPDGLYDLRVVVDDLAGNRTIDVVASRRVDNTAPVTTDDAAPGRHNTNQTVTLSRSDAGSGPSTTQYRVRAPGGSFGAWQSGTSVAIFASAGDGVSTIEYFSTDAAGNVESVKSTDVLIDTTGPSGTVTDPSTFLRGLVALTATADDPTDVSSVTFEYAPEGTAAWTQIGTDLTASGSDEYTVDWDTTAVADIAYDLQVTFLDSLGNPTVQALTGKTVDNELPTIALTAPPAGAVRRNVIAITATAADGVSGMREVRFEVKPAGAAGFSQVDVDNGSSPYSTAWDSTASPDGPTDVRVIAVDQAGNLRSATTTIFVDNDAPTLTVSAPSTAVSGTVTLTATGSSDIQSVVFKVGGSPIGTDNDGSDGFSVAWSTVGDGNQVVTAEATDVGGNVGTSSPVTVQVDNTAPTGAMTMPGNGATLSGTVALAATASDAGSGVSGTSFEYKRTSDSTWTAIGGSSWNTTAVATGAYNVRARVTDNAGNSAPTAAITVQVVPSAPVVVPPAPPAATPAPPAPSDPAPSIVASTPADGSVLRASPASLGVTASEPLSAVAALTLNGSPVGATITGASFSIEPGELDTGAYTLAGTLVDATGKTTPFRLHFTVVLGSPATPPFVEANAPSGAATSLTAVDGASFVTVPAGAVSGGGDWLVVRIQPLPASSVPAATTGAPASVVDVSARWALAGTEVHSFRFPLEIALTAASASLVPATLEDGRWRALEPVPGGASLPLLSRDGYVREGDRVRILTRHLSVFALIPAPRLVLSVAAAKNFSWTTRRFVAARVKVSRAATVTATLVGPRGARLATWRRTVRAGASVLKLPMPQTARTPGAYRIVVAATAGGQRVQRTLGLRIVRKDGSQHAPGPVNVALAGDTRIRRTLARGLRGTDMRVIAADADGAFTLAANRGVRVVLVDVDRHGTALVRDLNAVFPTLRLLALASRSADLRAATRVGADAVLPRSASSTRIARAVRRLAR